MTATATATTATVEAATITVPFVSPIERAKHTNPDAGPLAMPPPAAPAEPAPQDETEGEAEESRPGADRVQLTILREDQDHSLDLLRRGTAHGAVTATAAPVAGCTSRGLGVMRYRPVCTPAFAARWFADGVNRTTLSTAPVVIYDDKDDLQDRYLRRYRRTGLQPPRHYIPATHEFGQAIQLGLGWGMLPELQLAQLESGTLTPLTPAARVDIPLYWQQWRLTTAALDHIASAITDAAEALQPQPAKAPPRKTSKQSGPSQPRAADQLTDTVAPRTTEDTHRKSELGSS